jgi:hypothetical protein
MDSVRTFSFKRIDSGSQKYGLDVMSSLCDGLDIYNQCEAEAAWT